MFFVVAAAVDRRGKDIVFASSRVDAADDDKCWMVVIQRDVLKLKAITMIHKSVRPRQPLLLLMKHHRNGLRIHYFESCNPLILLDQ